VGSLGSAIRTVLLTSPDVTRLASLPRSTVLFSQDQPADAAYFIDSGLVKLCRKNTEGNRIILSICGADNLVGEEALADANPTYYAAAETLTALTAFRIPRATLLRTISEHTDFAGSLIRYVEQRKLSLAQKVELLCLHDVQYRILHYLAELSALVTPMEDGTGYELPITQLDLADLIGATRETTSTTLNQLERRGLVKLSRRRLTIPSPALLRSATNVASPNDARVASVT